MPLIRSIVVLLAVLLPTVSASAAELLMLRREGCPWCAAWDREIGPIYGKTDIGRRTPLRVLDLDRDRIDVALNTPVIYTPTFVLAEDGREVGRIEGYPGDHFFWGLLERLVQQLPTRQKHSVRPDCAAGADPCTLARLERRSEIRP
jgi:hypothetical protein